MRVNVRLFWEGTWDITHRRIADSIPSSQGIYIIVCENRGADGNYTNDPSRLYDLLYVGESHNIRQALQESKKWEKWDRSRGKRSLLMKLAKTDNLACRRKVASLLTFQNKPLCNTRFHNVSLMSCLHLTILHAGSWLPLKNPDPQQNMQISANMVGESA